MTNNTLPSQLNGFWIWLNEKKHSQDEVHQFFRRDFLLDELPASADIWIASRGNFHLFVNGRHCTAGAVASPVENSVYVCHVSAEYLLQPGINQIAIQAFNTNIPLTNAHGLPGGVWLQMDFDGEPFLWTDEYWMCLDAPGHIHTGIEQCYGGVNVEMIDFRKHPTGWNKEPFTPFRKGVASQIMPKQLNSSSNKFRWRGPDSMTPVTIGRVLLKGAPDSDEVVERLSWKEVASYGTSELRSQASWVNFRRQTAGRNSGIFVAETYINAPETALYNTSCFCNRPYRLYLNGEVLLEQAVVAPPVGADPSPRGDKPLAPADCVATDAVMNLQTGWNRLFLVIDCASSGHGMTILFDNCPVGELEMHTRPDEESPAGWSIIGPLRTPLALVDPALPLLAPTTDFLFAENPAWDMAVLQQTYKYKALPVEKLRRDTPTEEMVMDVGSSEGNSENNSVLVLSPGEYVVMDFGHTLYGYPVVICNGNEADAVDVICGEHLVDNRVVAYTGQRRNLTSLTLDGRRHNRWIATVPQGFRYVMVQIRSAENKVKILNCHARIFARQRVRSGFFSSSDEVLNKIWETGRRTLDSTFHGRYLDAPTGSQTQFIADGMIQAWAGFFLLGDYTHSAQALRDFAASQYETGELSSACPSGLFQVLPDYSMLWVTWLRRHYMYTGDDSLLQELFPVMERLLEYYNCMALVEDGPIGDIQHYIGIHPFLDHDNAIQRNGISTGLNALYNRALLDAAYLAETLGNHAAKKRYLRRAGVVCGYMRNWNWNSERGLFADSFQEESQSDSCSWQTNVLALFGALPEAEQYEEIWNRIFQDEEPFFKSAPGSCDNPYFRYFVGEVASVLGKSQWLYGMVRHYWGGMLEAGATTWWEMYSPGNNDDTRLFNRCQGYGVSPNGFIVEDLVGIRPLVPGMHRVLFAPALIDTVPKLTLEVPGPHGSIRVNWENTEEGLQVSISANYPLEVLPVLPAQVAAEATFSIGENITLVQPE